MESKINCNVAVTFGLWIIAFAVPNAFCAIVEGPFENYFELKETGLLKKSDNQILQWYDGKIYLFKYTNEDKSYYTIGFPVHIQSDYSYSVKETYSFETNEIKYHIMHREFMNLELENDRSLIISFEKLADARIFYILSCFYINANQISAGPFELLLITKQGSQYAVLTIYRIDNENLVCEFADPNERPTQDAVNRVEVLVVLPTRSFSHTDIYLQLRVGLIVEKMGNIKDYYILKFYKKEDAVNFFNAIHDKSEHITQISDELASLDGNYAM